ncbi:DUF4129 domain-containing protein [Chryseobacterium sp.]|uniref:DUF4129 domain-containing protein n=1 Tax=Chryseobacterium sp. TaxID=1871047 RepID=UPI001656A364|nr:DUF4129 domain-containing protein [Chryseobacterium sp.]
MKLRFSLLFLLFLCAAFSAQEPVSGTTKIDSILLSRYSGSAASDSFSHGSAVTDNQVYPKKFAQNYRQQYRGADFDYSGVKPRESIWQKFLKKVEEIIDFLFDELNPGKAMGITGIIIRVLAILLISFLIYFLLRFLVSRYGTFSAKKNNKVIINGTEVHENIHEINFAETILAYEQQGDFRSAVRYRFLNVLKNLTDRNVILWTPEKTNRDYLSEITQPDLKQQFSDLVYIYDNVWYGEFSIDEASYKHFSVKFDSVVPSKG